MLLLVPVAAYAQTVPEQYREEIRAVLLAGTIGSDVDEQEFEHFVDALSLEAYNANVTGADLTQVQVESLVSAVGGFDAEPVQKNAVREPNVGVLWGTVALLLLILIIGRYYRRMHQGGALAHQ